MRGVTYYRRIYRNHQQFLLTRLMRGVTSKKKNLTNSPRFLLTRLMRGVTILAKLLAQIMCISTHTPHARRDFVKELAAARGLFLLTRLMRGVT